MGSKTNKTKELQSEVFGYKEKKRGKQINLKG